MNTFADVLVTTRSSEGYSECKNILDSLGLKYFCIGGYGGGERSDKFLSRVERMRGFLDLFKSVGMPDVFIAGASVEGVSTAFGLGIKIALFADTPVYFQRDIINQREIEKSNKNMLKNLESKTIKYKKTLHSPKYNLKKFYYKKYIYSSSSPKITILSRLCFPLATKIFYPFVLPKSCFKIAKIEPKNLIRYDFIDVALWLKDEEDSKNTIKTRKSSLHNSAGNDFRDILNKDRGLKIEKKFSILFREEEFKAHYVERKLSIIYECIELLSKNINCNIFIMPRYGSEHLKSLENLHNVYILDKIFSSNEFYPYIDCLIGGGGTMNLESTFLNIPTISLRSIFLYHDLYLIKNNLMFHATNAKEVLNIVTKIISHKSPNCMKNEDLFIQNTLKSGTKKIINEIKKMIK